MSLREKINILNFSMPLPKAMPIKSVYRNGIS